MGLWLLLCFLLCFYRYTSALMLNTVHNLNELWSANTIWTCPFLKSTWSWVHREVGENLGGVGAKGSKYILWDSQRLNKGIFKKIKYNANLFEILTSSTPFFSIWKQRYAVTWQNVSSGLRSWAIPVTFPGLSQSVKAASTAPNSLIPVFYKRKFSKWETSHTAFSICLWSMLLPRARMQSDPENTCQVKAIVMQRIHLWQKTVDKQTQTPRNCNFAPTHLSQEDKYKKVFYFFRKWDNLYLFTILRSRVCKKYV